MGHGEWRGGAWRVMGWAWRVGLPGDERVKGWDIGVKEWDMGVKGATHGVKGWGMGVKGSVWVGHGE